MTLTGQDLATVETLARRHGVDEREVVRRAVAVLKELIEELGRGSTIRSYPEDQGSHVIDIAYTRPGRQKLGVTLGGSAMVAVETIAHDHGLTEGEVVRWAIDVLKELLDEMDRGCILRLHTSRGETERLRIQLNPVSRESVH